MKLLSTDENYLIASAMAHQVNQKKQNKNQ